MIRSLIVFGLFLVVLAGTASAQEVGCSVTAVNMVSQDQGTVTIDCSGLSEAFGKDFAAIMTRILKDRLDPQMVMQKLDEIDRVPEEGVARTVDENQRQRIIQSLFGKPPGHVAIIAHPKVEDSAEFAKGIATSLLQVGWQIDGQQIRRAAPQSIEPIPGVAVVVRDKGAAAPQQAELLRSALNAAHIPAALATDPALAPDATVLWIGRRPEYLPETAK